MKSGVGLGIVVCVCSSHTWTVFGVDLPLLRVEDCLMNIAVEPHSAGQGRGFCRECKRGSRAERNAEKGPNAERMCWNK